MRLQQDERVIWSSLKGITFVNTSLFLDECSLKMADCSFVSGSIDALSLNFFGYSTGNIDLDSCSFRNNSASGLKISGNSVNLIISNSSFDNNKLHSESNTIFTMSAQSVQVEDVAKFTVNFTSMNVSQNSCPGQACFEIVAGMNGKLTLEMDQVIFEHNKAGESILDIRNSSNAYVKFKSTQFTENAGRAVKLHDGNALELKIVKGTFVDNNIGQKGDGGAVSVSRFTQKAFVSLSRSKVRSNKAENGGACAFKDIFFLLLNIEGCQFEQNEAWITGGAIAIGVYYSSPQHNATIDIRNSHFSGNVRHSGAEEAAYHNTSYNCEAAGGGGGGGALTLYMFNTQSLSLTNNTFEGNKAEGMNPAGAIQARLGTLYMDVVVHSCKFIRNSGGAFAGTLQFEVNGKLSTFEPPIVIRNSTFFENKGGSYYDIYLYSRNLIISSCKIQSNSGGGMYFGTYPKNILVENSLISDNFNFELYLCYPSVRIYVQTVHV